MAERRGTARKAMAAVRHLRPLHGPADRYLDNVAGTVAALKKETNARVVVLGPVPPWRRALPNHVLRYFMLHHRPIPQRSGEVRSNWPDPMLRARLVQIGPEFISVSEVMCND